MNVPSDFHPIETAVVPMEARCAFHLGRVHEDPRGIGYGVLGRHSFFNGLTFIKFRDYLSELEIRKRRM